ncbi:hypothetical protein PFAG_04117 [Plasmodium falciparum Santa Lucia]|uniref:Uncharacterized protein n=2 Tax=Plasmodium falciparum TaxID=5833 RepID=A0A024V3I2_PLAFA|nr:hypothetical protein PFFVO_03730 [Plasmodium falciparum Vietnam Oak-Knoll (FVO)]EUT81936.1 hypothetical protein PFAG_04117 [Plasmodium falciparum Santa Lucia]
MSRGCNNQRKNKGKKLKRSTENFIKYIIFVHIDGNSFFLIITRIIQIISNLIKSIYNVTCIY